MTNKSSSQQRRLTVVDNPDQARQIVRDAQHRGLKVGLIPTMGALHEGHVSLVRAAQTECEFVVATIFVNPTQFGPREDFSKYPRTFESDCEMLEAANTNLVFAPSAGRMYPAGFSTFIDPPALALRWEGEHRPGHFRGVCTVVLKLFQILPADFAYFGQKDYQQSAVIRRMVADLDLPIGIRVCATVREPDGLAMSSRNTYLSAEERNRALAISRGLRLAEALVGKGERDSQTILNCVTAVLRESKIESIDYLAIVDPDSLEPAERVDSPKVLLVAAFVGKTRLIDNLRIG